MVIIYTAKPFGVVERYYNSDTEFRYCQGIYAFNSEEDARSACGDDVIILWTSEDGWLDAADNGVFMPLALPAPYNDYDSRYALCECSRHSIDRFKELLSYEYVSKDDGLKIEYEPVIETEERKSLAKKAVDEIYKERFEISGAASALDLIDLGKLRNYDQQADNFCQPFTIDLTKSKQEVLAVVKEALREYGVNFKPFEEAMLSGDYSTFEDKAGRFIDQYEHSFINNSSSLEFPCMLTCFSSHALRDIGNIYDTPSDELFAYLDNPETAAHVDYVILADEADNFNDSKVRDITIVAVDYKAIYDAEMAKHGQIDQESEDALPLPSLDEGIDRIRGSIKKDRWPFSEQKILWDSENGWHEYTVHNIAAVPAGDLVLGDLTSGNHIVSMLNSGMYFMDALSGSVWPGESHGEQRPAIDYEAALQEQEEGAEDGGKPSIEDFDYHFNSSMSALEQVQDMLKPIMYSGIFFNTAMPNDELAKLLKGILESGDTESAKIFGFEQYVDHPK